MTTDVGVDSPELGSRSAPPEDVLDSCNWNYSSVIDTSVFIHGTLTVHYNGTVPEEVQIAPGASVSTLSDLEQLGGGTAGLAGVHSPDGSSWDLCGGAAANWLYEFQPGSSQTVDWWADLQVISNAHPTFTAADKQALAIKWFAFGSDQLGTAPKVSGANAASCGTGSEDQTPFLLLYGSPPQSYHGQDVNGTPVNERCAAP